MTLLHLAPRYEFTFEKLSWKSLLDKTILDDLIMALCECEFVKTIEFNYISFIVSEKIKCGDDMVQLTAALNLITKTYTLKICDIDDYCFVPIKPDYISYVASLLLNNQIIPLYNKANTTDFTAEYIAE